MTAREHVGSVGHQQREDRLSLRGVETILKEMFMGTLQENYFSKLKIKLYFRVRFYKKIVFENLKIES